MIIIIKIIIIIIIIIIKFTCRIIVQNANTALQDTGIKYSITIFGNQVRSAMSCAPSKFKIFICFLIQFVRNICYGKWKSIW